MGCKHSKEGDAANPVVVYRPPPSSIAVFDITAVEVPWLKFDAAAHDGDHGGDHKLSHVPATLLEKLDTFEKDVSGAPRTWDEVSKALHQDLKKPSITNPGSTPKPGSKPKPGSNPNPKPMPKSLLVHTIDELDKPPKAAEGEGRIENGNKALNRVNKSDLNPVGPDLDRVVLNRVDKSGSNRFGPDLDREEVNRFPGSDSGSFRSVKANPFIMRDRVEREKEGKEAAFDKIMKAKRDPLGEFPEICPPGGAQLVVLYTTSLGGVRRTFEDCNRVRAILEFHRVVFDERDVSLHPGFLTELRELVGGGGVVVVPRVFVKGRYLGGAEEVVEMNEDGRLGRVLSHARVERGPGWQGCEGCGGARFVPCLECGGSCKVVVENGRDRCPKCNENGLIQCPRCH